MTDNEAAKARAEMSTALMEVQDQFRPIIDAADGMRVDMERRGWSPTAAEQASLSWLLGAIAQVWKQA